MVEHRLWICKVTIQTEWQLNYVKRQFWALNGELKSSPDTLTCSARSWDSHISEIVKSHGVPRSVIEEPSRPAA